MTKLRGAFKRMCFGTVAALVPVGANSQAVCPDLSVVTNGIKDRYSTEFEAIKAEGEAMQGDFSRPNDAEAVVGVNFDVEWVDQKWIFDIPTVNMREQKWIFDTPSVVVKDHTIIFHTPSVRMVTIKCGQYPEIHGTTVKWSDIFCDVPQTFMEEQKIIMGIPEFFMETQEVILHVPEFEMARQEWIMRIPEFTATDVNVEVGELKERAGALKGRSDAVSNSLKSELVSAISSGFDCYEANLTSARSTLVAQMDLAINHLSNSIQQVKASGGDPKAVSNNLENRLTILVGSKNEQVAKIDQAIQDLQSKEKNAIDRLVAPVPAQ